jgi:hypothetical protein
MKNELIAMQKSESEKLLDECRELFTHRMSSSMTRMMEYIEDVLIKMAKPDKNKEVLLHFIEAAEVLRSKKHENHTRFENRFNSLYHNSVYKMNTGVSSHHFTSEDIESNFERDINESGDSVKIKKTLNNARDK